MRIVRIPSRARVAISLLAIATIAPAREPVDRKIEDFLRAARVIDREPLARGVTHSARVTLSDGTQTHRAVWKTIDETAQFKRFERGLPELGFSDTYKNEIAAYELSKLLGLDIVPPTVERRLGRRRGSMQLWIDGCMTEAERYTKNLQPPDTEEWFRQLYTVRLFRQLIYDTDYKNASNILVTCEFRLWSVDHSRAFRTRDSLLDAGCLLRFSRALLTELRALDSETLEAKLGELISPRQRDAILARRDLILARASELVGDLGEDSVLYP